MFAAFAASSKPPSQKPTLSTEPWASQSAVAAVYTAFQEACQRDLHASVTRLKLYLEDDRTVGVLLKHVQDRILDEYREFRETVLEAYSYGSSIRGEVGSDDMVRLIVLGICDGGTGEGAGSSS